MPGGLTLPGGSGGGGGGRSLGPETNTFGTSATASRAAAQTLRNNYASANAAWLAQYNGNRNFVIHLVWNGGDAFERRNVAGTGWEDVTDLLIGRRGPGPTDGQVTAAVQAGVKPYARIGGRLISGPDADSAFLLENEVTQSFLLNIFGLTAQELNDLFVNAVVSGSGLSQSITITQADGSTFALALPDTTGGDGGGGTADGRVSSVAFAADGTTLTLTLTTGATVSASVPAALRQAGLSQSQVQALINAAEADDLTVAQVASQISTALANYREFASVFSRSADYTLQVSDRGDTIRLTGGTARTFSAPSAAPNGWWARLLNTSSAVLTFDVGVTARIEGAGQTLEIPAGDCVTVQYLGASTWAVVTDTAGEAGDDGGGSAPAERVVLAISDQVQGTGTDGQTGASGVASQALPTDYNDFDNTELIVYDPRNNTTTFIYLRNAWLAAQTDGNAPKLGASDQDEAGTRQWITWTPSTRLFGRSGQSATATARDILRIVGVRLFNDGGAGGSAGEVADGSLTPAKMDSDTEAKQKAFRETFASAHIGQGAALPLAAVSNVGDVWIFPQAVSSGLAWRDVSDQATVIDSADAGDVGLYIGARGWVRVGNIFRRPGTPHALFVSPGQIQKGSITNKFELNLFIAPGLYTNVTKAQVTIGGVEQTIATPEITDHVTVRSIQVLVTTAMRNALEALDDNAVDTVIVRLLNASDVQQAEITAELLVVAGGGADTTARAAATANERRLDAIEPRTTALESKAWTGTAYVTPHELHAGIGTFTMRATLRRVDGTFPNGSRMRIAAGTRNGAFVHATEDLNTPATLAFDAAQSRALIQNTTNGWIGGPLYLDVYQSDETTRITRIPIYVPVVQGSVGPLITNIAAYDATQDRFEDSTGGQVALPAGAIVLTTQAIYDAAAADSFAFPANVIFLTR